MKPTRPPNARAASGAAFSAAGKSSLNKCAAEVSSGFASRIRNSGCLPMRAPVGDASRTQALLHEINKGGGLRFGRFKPLAQRSSPTN